MKKTTEVEVLDEKVLPLDAEAKEAFSNCLAIVDNGMAICALVGNALRTIKERQYYRSELNPATGDPFKSFDDFCSHRWGKSMRYCNQLIVDANTINALPEALRHLIQSHKAANELSKIPELLRPSVVMKATDGGVKPADAPAIRQHAPPRPAKPSGKAPARRGAVAPAKAPSKRNKPVTPIVEVRKDKTGIPIPEEILALWDRGHEVVEILTYLDAVRSRLGKAAENDDPLFMKAINIPTICATVNQASSEIETAIPFAVCPGCQGKLAPDCNECKGRGFVSDFYWKHSVPVEKKNLRPLPNGRTADKL